MIDNNEKEKKRNIEKYKKGRLNILIVTFLLILISALTVISIKDLFRDYKITKTKKIALNYIDSLRTNLIDNNALTTGIFYFQSDLLDNKNIESPLGGNFRFDNPLKGQIGSYKVQKVAPYIYKVISNPTPKCYANAYSFVEISYINNDYVYKICLTAGYEEKYVLGLEKEIKDEENTYVIKS